MAKIISLESYVNKKQRKFKSAREIYKEAFKERVRQRLRERMKREERARKIIPFPKNDNPIAKEGK